MYNSKRLNILSFQGGTLSGTNFANLEKNLPRRNTIYLNALHTNETSPLLNSLSRQRSRHLRKVPNVMPLNFRASSNSSEVGNRSDNPVLNLNICLEEGKSRCESEKMSKLMELIDGLQQKVKMQKEEILNLKVTKDLYNTFTQPNTNLIPKQMHDEENSSLKEVKKRVIVRDKEILIGNEYLRIVLEVKNFKEALNSIDGLIIIPHSDLTEIEGKKSLVEKLETHISHSQSSNNPNNDFPFVINNVQENTNEVIRKTNNSIGRYNKELLNASEQMIVYSKSLDKEVEEIAHEIVTKNTKIKELIEVIASNSVDDYFIKKEQEYNKQLAELNRMKYKLKEDQCDLNKKLLSLKSKEEDIIYKEQLIAKQLEQFKIDNVVSNKEKVELENRIHENKLLRIKRELEDLITNNIHSEGEIEYSIPWLGDMHNALKKKLEDINALKVKEIDELLKENSILKKQLSEYEDINKKQENTLANMKLKVELDNKRIKEELEYLRTLNQKLIASIHLIFSKRNNDHINKEDKRKHSRPHSARNQKTNNKDEKKMNYRMEESVIVNKIKKHVNTLLENYKKSIPMGNNKEITEKLINIVVNTELEVKKLDQILIDLHSTTNQRLIEEMKAVQEAEGLAKYELTLKLKEKALGEKEKYLTNLINYLKTQQQELFNKEQSLLITEMHSLQLKNKLTTIMDLLMNDLERLKEQEKDIINDLDSIDLHNTNTYLTKQKIYIDKLSIILRKKSELLCKVVSLMFNSFVSNKDEHVLMWSKTVNKTWKNKKDTTSFDSLQKQIEANKEVLNTTSEITDRINTIKKHHF